MTSMLWIDVPSALLVAGFLLWLPTRLRYRITDRHLQITLFGVPVRRVRLTNIDRVTKRHGRWAEQWWNTWRPFRRRLMICRHRGLCKNLVITPKYRYEFKAELERAIARANAQASGQAKSWRDPIEVRN